jgi:hypothetical protein
MADTDTRKISLNLDTETERKINELIAYAAERNQRSDMTSTIRSAINILHEQLVESTATYWPMYQDVYVETGEPDHERGDIEVYAPEGDFTAWLKRAESFEEALAAPRRFVVVGHPLKYPFAKYDYEEIWTEAEKSRFAHIIGDLEPRLYTEATIVYTPKMALV